jgi:hypothetical protein
MPVPACGSRRAREGTSSEAEVSPRARRNPLEGGVGPRARRKPLEGVFDWATLVGRGGHRDVGRALCVRLSERCVLSLFFSGFKQDSPGFLGPKGCPDNNKTQNLNPQVWRPTCWHCQAPEHVEGEGSEEQTKHAE